MIFTTVPDKASTDIFTESVWDDHVRDNLNNLISPPVAMASSLVAQGIPTGAFTLVTFGLVDLDSDGMLNPNNPTTMTVRTPGLYLGSAWLAYNINATGIRGVYAANSLRYEMRADNNGAGGTVLSSPPASDFNRSAGETLSVLTFQDCGATLNLNAARHWQIWVGRTS